MADLLPDIPADLFNNWSADQFGQAAQAKIASLGSDISQGVQNALSPPAAAPAEQPPLPPEPPPPPTPPEPAPEPPSPPSAPAPTDTSPPPQPASFDDLIQSGWQVVQGGAQQAAQAAQQVPASFDDLVSSGWQVVGGAAQQAAQAAQQVPATAQDLANAGWEVVQGAGQQAGQAAQSLGIQGPQSKTPGDFIDVARQAALAANIDPEIFTRQIQQESGFNPSAKSGAGALGIAQFMPGTAAGMGIDPTDPVASLQAAARLDAQNLAKYGGDWGKALAAYNAGGGNVDKYGGIPPFAETQSYVSNILGGAKDVVQNAASAGATAVNSIGQAAQSAVARTSQFAMGLSSGDAMAFCGPAAAMAFAETFGRNPTVDEARQLAAKVGWGPDQGMAGPGSEVALLESLGIDTHMTQGVNWQQVAQDASSGNPVIIDTPGHYFYVDGYNADTGQFHLGSSATDLKASGGKEWYTPDQIPGLGMGAPRAAIFADHPLSGPGVASAAQQVASGAQNLLSQGWQMLSGAAEGASQKAEDTMSAVIDTGTQTMQDTLSGAFGLNSPETQAWLAAHPDQAAQLSGTWDWYRGAPTEEADWTSPHLISSLGIDPLAGLQRGIGDITQGVQSRDVLGTLGGGLETALTLGSALPGENFATADPLLRNLVTSPELQAALRSRQAAEAEVNAALGGLPSLFGVGEGVPAAEAGNWSRVAGPPGIGPEGGPRFGPGGTPQITGAGLMQRAMDELSAYPDEIAGPIRQFASDALQSGMGDMSQISSTIRQWMGDNPLHTVPDPITGPIQLVRDAGQQAVADIADMVRTASRGGGPYLPGGTMPGQLGLLPDTEVQRLLEEGAGGAGVPQAGLSTGEQSWLRNVQSAIANRDFGGLQDALQQAGLLGGRAGEQPGVLPGFESDFQRALQEGTGAAGVPSGGLSGSEAQWLADLRNAAAQRDFGGIQKALEDAGLLGDQTGTRMPSPDFAFSRGGAAQFVQDVLPNFNPRDPVSLGDWFKLLHTGSVTSGVGTLSKVFVNSALQPAWNLGTRGIYDLLTGNPGRASGALMGVVDAFRQAGEDALLGIRDAYMDPSAVSSRVDNPIAQTIARLFESPMNVHASLQNFNQTFGSKIELARMAGQQATNEGLLPFTRAWQERYTELLANPHPAAQAAADAVGQRMAMRGELGGWGDLINRLVKSNENGGQSTVGNTIWPVFRIGWNGAVQRVEKSPLGLLAPTGTIGDVIRGIAGYGPYAGAKASEILPALRNELTAGGLPINSPFNYPVQRGVTPLAERFANNISGTATGLLTAAIATALTGKGLAGVVTGAGPQDKATRDQLTAGGWLNNAINTGSGYMDYSNMPGSETLSLIGNLMDAINYPTASEQRDVLAGRASGVPDWIYQKSGAEPAHAAIDQAAFRLVQHVGQSLGSEAGLRQIADIADMVYGRQSPGTTLTNTLGSTLGGFIPMSGALRSAALAGDVSQRQPEPGNIGQAIEQNLPGLRGQVPTRLSPLGAPEPNPQAGLGALAPYRLGAGVNDPTLQVLDQHGVTIPSQDKVATARTGTTEASMLPNEQHMVEMRRGYLIQQNVRSLTSDPLYQRASSTDQSAMLQRAISNATTQAEGEFIADLANRDPSRLEPAKKVTVPVPAGRPRVPITTP